MSPPMPAITLTVTKAVAEGTDAPATVTAKIDPTAATPALASDVPLALTSALTPLAAPICAPGHGEE